MRELPVVALPDARAAEVIQDLLGPPNEAPADVRLTVTGACMAPALPEGTIVSLARANAARPRLGDVVLVRLPSGLRLHRLVWGPPLAGRRWRTKGDRSLLWDPAVDPMAVLAWVREADAGPSPVRAVGAALRSLARGLLARVRSARRLGA
jgi:hypothetical protein